MPATNTLRGCRETSPALPIGAKFRIASHERYAGGRLVKNWSSCIKPLLGLWLGYPASADGVLALRVSYETS